MTEQQLIMWRQRIGLKWDDTRYDDVLRADYEWAKACGCYMNVRRIKERLGCVS